MQWITLKHENRDRLQKKNEVFWGIMGQAVFIEIPMDSAYNFLKTWQTDEYVQMRRKCSSPANCMEETKDLSTLLFLLNYNEWNFSAGGELCEDQLFCKRSSDSVSGYQKQDTQTIVK